MRIFFTGAELYHSSGYTLQISEHHSRIVTKCVVETAYCITTTTTTKVLENPCPILYVTPKCNMFAVKH